MKRKLEESYGFLFEADLIDEIVSVGSLKKFKHGDVIIDYDNNVKSMPLLINGAIKILRQDNQGNELALYYLERGDTCTMTMTCCLGQKKSEIRAIAETDVELIILPVENMKTWTKTYDSWMSFVFKSYNSRFNEMLESIDNLAFNNMHERLHKYLKDQVLIKKTTELTISHQDIAYDMHTSRVVISRLLKSLEKEQKLVLGRNKISILKF
jgi:CRP/FNR family transcriptional regulator